MNESADLISNNSVPTVVSENTQLQTPDKIRILNIDSEIDNEELLM